MPDPSPRDLVIRGLYSVAEKLAALRAYARRVTRHADDPAVLDLRLHLDRAEALAYALAIDMEFPGGTIAGRSLIQNTEQPSAAPEPPQASVGDEGREVADEAYEWDTGGPAGPFPVGSTWWDRKLNCTVKVKGANKHPDGDYSVEVVDGPYTGCIWDVKREQLQSIGVKAASIPTPVEEAIALLAVESPPPAEVAPTTSREWVSGEFQGPLLPKQDPEVAAIAAASDAMSVLARTMVLLTEAQRRRVRAYARDRFEEVIG